MPSSHRVLSASLESSIFALRPRQQCIRCLLNQRRSYAAERERYKPYWKDEPKTPEEEMMRREYDSWINGPGSAFRRPLPGSTNYLSAYSKEGSLRRARSTNRQQSESRTTRKAESEAEEENLAKALEEDVSEEEKAKREQTVKDLEKAADKESASQSESQLPRERLSDLRPFPANTVFWSQPVLSEELREMLYVRVKEQGRSIRQVSADFKVSMERVAAVVRMKQMERDWLAKGKVLAMPYSRQVLAMLPQTPYKGDRADPSPHESINDLAVHPATTQQIFYPTPESRTFTRADAGNAFRAGLLPADKRIPHPELVMLEKMKAAKMTKAETAQAMQKYSEEEAKAIAKKKREAKAIEEKTVKVYKGFRWDFRFTDFSLDNTIGKDERSRKAVGVRYGMPHEDRKRGQVKIPTHVD